MNLVKRKISPTKFRHRLAQESDAAQWVSLGQSVSVDGIKEMAYVAAPDCEHLREPLLQLKFSKNVRANGMQSRSRVFGTLPRRPMQRADFCSWATIETDAPELHSALLKFAEKIFNEQWKQNPMLAKMQADDAKTLHPAYQFGCYTSGIINFNNQLPYHFDAGNVPGRWSAMLTFKRGCEGGDLVLPEINAGIRLADSSLLFFDGQRFLHGVTPFKLEEKGHRVTVVFYTMKQIWKCLPPTEELERAQQNETARNRTRANAH